MSTDAIIVGILALTVLIQSILLAAATSTIIKQRAEIDALWEEPP